MHTTHCSHERFDFEGRTAFIAGGTSGIGLAAARAFAGAGARVAIGGRDKARGEDALAALGSSGNEALFVELDVRDEASVAASVAKAEERFGRIDVAFNCAGAGGDMAPLDRADQTVWDDVMATNARGTWIAMRHEIPALVRAGGGAIVNMSSIYGLVGKAAHHAYVASKHAIVGMTRSVALEYASRGVRVNALCAGLTATEGVRRAEELVPELVGALVREHPIGRMASVEEIARAVLFLASPASSFVTGIALAVDGGLTAA